MTKGKCYFCDKIIGRTAMKKHLETCEKRKEKIDKESQNKTHMFQLFVECSYGKDFWMHIGINTEKSLRLLDEFLREIWLECCGHLSMFTINGVEYSSDSETGKSMKVKLSKILHTGTKFSHEYDFGTPTELTLVVEKEYDTILPKDKSLEVLARNEIPEINCKCGKKAEYICSICFYDEPDGFLLCKSCAKKHECGEEALLPIVNSPRAGVCGYEGPAAEIKYF